jgi:hypothetical protein
MLDGDSPRGFDVPARRGVRVAWYAEAIVARPEKHIPVSLEEAVAELKRDPHRTVHARVDNFDVEIRVLESPAHKGAGLGDRMAAAGPWQGETEEEILEMLREARRTGSSEDPPQMP